MEQNFISKGHTREGDPYWVTWIPAVGPGHIVILRKFDMVYWSTAFPGPKFQKAAQEIAAADSYDDLLGMTAGTVGYLDIVNLDMLESHHRVRISVRGKASDIRVENRCNQAFREIFEELHRRVGPSWPRRCVPASLNEVLAIPLLTFLVTAMIAIFHCEDPSNRTPLVIAGWSAAIVVLLLWLVRTIVNRPIAVRVTRPGDITQFGETG